MDPHKFELLKALMSSAQHCVTVQEVKDIIKLGERMMNDKGESVSERMVHFLRSDSRIISGDKIGAIRILRTEYEDVTGKKLGLAEAKYFVEHVLYNRPCDGLLKIVDGIPQLPS